MAANFIQEEELFESNEQEVVQDITTPVPDSTTAGHPVRPCPAGSPHRRSGSACSRSGRRRTRNSQRR